MYKITYAPNIWGKKALCRAGFPENMYPDLCIYNENSPSNFTEVNSVVLRDALLSSIEILDKLGLVVISKEDYNKLTQDCHNNPPFENEEEKAPAQADEAATSEAVMGITEQEPTPTQPERIFTAEEKKVLNKVTKAFAEEHGCSIKEAKAHIALHIDEYLPKENS